LLSSAFTQVLILLKPVALCFNLHIKLAAFIVPLYHMFQILIICVKLWKSWRIIELSVKSPCLWACFQPLSPLSVVSAPQNKELLLNLSMKCSWVRSNYGSCTGRSLFSNHVGWVFYFIDNLQLLFI
jgi:hypothetical protein